MCNCIDQLCVDIVSRTSIRRLRIHNIWNSDIQTFHMAETENGAHCALTSFSSSFPRIPQRVCSRMAEVVLDSSAKRCSPDELGLI